MRDQDQAMKTFYLILAVTGLVLLGFITVKFQRDSFMDACAKTGRSLDECVLMWMRR